MDQLRRPRIKRSRRVLRIVVRSFVGLLVFVAAVPILALAALRIASVRAFVTNRVDSALAGTFRGRIHLRELARVDLGGVRLSGSIDDPSGHTVARFEQAEVDLSVPSLLIGVVRGGGSPSLIGVDRLSLKHGEVRLIDDGHGSPTLASAFEPRTPSPPTPSSKPSPRVELRRIVLDHVWVHGALASTPWIDTDLSRVAASFVLDPKEMRIDLQHAKLDARFAPLNPHGSLKASAVLPAGNAPPDVTGEYHGTLAGTELAAKGAFQKQRLEADLSLPSVNAATLARFAPDLRLRGTLSAVAHVAGPLDALAVNAAIQGDEVGSVRLSGTAGVTEPQHAAVKLEVNRLNAAAVAPTAPETRVDASATLDAKLEGGRWQGSYEVSLPSASVSGQTLPRFATHGSAHGKGANADVDGEASLSETGLETTISYRVTTEGSRGQVDASLRTQLADPPRLEKLAGVRTRGTIDARALFGWPSNAVDATANVNLEGVQQAAAQTGPLKAKLTAQGPVDHLQFTADVAAVRLHAAGRNFDQARVRAAGTPEDVMVGLRLEAPEHQGLSAHAEVKSAQGAIELVGPSLAYSDREGALNVSAEHVNVAGADLAVERFVLDGAGHAAGSLRLRRGQIEGDVQTRALDLGRFLKLAGVATPIKSAHATLAARFTGDKRARGEGSVNGTITDIGYGRVTGGWASLDLKLAKSGAVSGMVETELVKGAKVVVGIDDIVPTALGNGKSWAPSGRVRVSGKLDLSCMSPLIGSFSAVPIEDAKGTVDVDVAYNRESLDAFPELKARVRTHDLTLVGRREAREKIETPAEAIAAAPAVYRGLDVGVTIGLDEQNPRLAVLGELYDTHGTLLHVDASAGPWLDQNLQAVLAGLRDAPLDVKASVPARKLRLLPAPIRPESLRGTVGGDATFDGTISHPHLVVDARASRLASLSERVAGEKHPTATVIAHAEYAQRGGKLELIAQHEKEKAVDVRASWDGDAVLAATSPAERRRLKLKADVLLAELDLATIPALKNRQVEGTLSGTAHVEYGADKRVLSADFAAHPLRVGQADMDRVNIALDATPTKVAGAVVVRGKAGSLDAKLGSGMAWPAGGTPSLEGAIRASLAARDLRLAMLQPMLGSAVNELDGKLSADLSATVDDGNVQLKGKGQLTEGVVQLPAIGQRFDDINAKIDVEPTELVMRDLSAHGVTGAVHGNARVEVDQHLALKQATAELDIPKNQKLPLTVQGVAIGDAWGHVETRIVSHPDKMEVAVKIPELHLFVPDSGGGDVQDLAPDEQVRVGFRRSDAKFVALAVQPLAKPSENPTPLDLTVELGKQVSVKKGDLVTAEVTGKIQVHVADKTEVTGQINVKGGTLDVSGKRFEIENGTVTFTDDAANPVVSATARWDAPAGYSVYATYTGTAKKGNLELRAEPPLSQEEILNLILFGTPEGSVSSGSGDTATSAVGVAGGTATKGINRALSDFTHLDIQARIDTSTGDSRPELMVPVNKFVSARLTRAVGEPPPGTSPDRTFVTLELRLKRYWVLSAMFGDRGASALDLIWRRHY
jgi:autotransporter translocation and assembly factor TamB